MKKVLLIEPNYNNKYPPIALMKLATYYRNRGDWEVVFFKGDLKLFIIERITDKLIVDLNNIDTSDTDWRIYKDILFNFIKTRKNELLDQLPLNGDNVFPLLYDYIYQAKDYYYKGIWEKQPEWDRVGVTTLFTFYWDITIETINFAKKLVKNPKDLMVGGVLASIQPNEIEQATGIRPHVGLLNTPGELDPGDNQIIDELELDYSILDEIEYEYPMTNAYYGYMTRGCIRHCPFCAVPTLEPTYKSYIPLKNRIERTANLYGPQKDLLLMDNNVLASRKFPLIIQDIIDCGFGKDEIFKEPNYLEIALRNLKLGINDRAYTRKIWKIINSLYDNATGEKSYELFSIIDKYHLQTYFSSTKENLILAAEEVKDIYDHSLQHLKGKKRYVDFNQGVDARLFTKEKVELLSKIAIRPLRIAFDDIKSEPEYTQAIRMSVEAGLHDFSNYLLYNFHDTPDELYYRLKINVDLSEKLDVSIYSFPMKYHPIKKEDQWDQDYSHNRDYIGEHWNRKYIRAIQAVLNSTKGKIGRGKEFFEKAFGKNIEEFHRLLEMPETFIIYRFFFDWMNSPEAHMHAKELFGHDTICMFSTERWWNAYIQCQRRVSIQTWNKVLQYIHANDFSQELGTYKNEVKILLTYYIDKKQDILDEHTQIYKMKQIYDKNPTKDPKRHNHKSN
ncbi:MAG: hypothetical protein IKZ46_10285 [Victivallales bacterium]|nr:hypothetical protein [Victivallales bacterium]